MTRLPLLLILLLLPAPAFAQTTYDLSCGRIDPLTNELKVVEAREAE